MPAAPKNEKPDAEPVPASQAFSTECQVLPESDSALLIVDFINPLQFKGAERIMAPALQAARATRKLRDRLKLGGTPVIYANDNYGLWQSNFAAMVAYCQQLDGEVGEMARVLAPGEHDIAILKPRHSAFYATPLELLLDQMKVRKLIVAGLATDMCVQMTAMDAYLRSYATWVPRDCNAAETERAHDTAMHYMQGILNCDIHSSASGT
jgi:nicotinamidase-related amidase